MGLLHINREIVQSLREEQRIWTDKIREKCPNSCVLNLILRKISLRCKSLQRYRSKKPAFATGTAYSGGEGGRDGNEAFFSLFLAFFNVSLSLLQATNSHTNEVVAVKKMSYSGKQMNEVRGIKAIVHSGAVAAPVEI